MPLYTWRCKKCGEDTQVVRKVKDIEMSPEILRKYEGFLHKAHKNRRKMLNKAFTKEQLGLGGIDPKLRPQNLDAQEWLDFFNKLLNSGNL